MNHLGAWCEAQLRRLCEAMSPDLRLYVIIGMLLLFAALSLYTTLSAIGNIGRSSGSTLEIEHLRYLELEQPSGADSLRTQTPENHERKTAE